jgi:2-polyprenyl-3-methyl-5-hydroxy-6-metoxy-1,4-benzoquinol methylase
MGEPAGFRNGCGASVTADRREHWERVYAEKTADEVSWYQRDPTLSLALIEAAGIRPEEAVLDVGGGASLVVDRLLERGFRDVTVLDVAESALDVVRARLGSAADGRVELVRADVTRFAPSRRYALWHDRAVFHFLTGPEDRRAYVAALQAALQPRGHAIVATFALDGPERCSGLEVARYDAAGLAAELGAGLELRRVEAERHVTPAGRAQSFQYCLFRATE